MPTTNNKLKQLQDTKTLDDLASLLSVPLQAFTYVLHGRFRHGLSNYHSFKILKKNGGERTINAPVDELKNIQRKLSALLQDCQKTINILEGHRSHDKNLTTIAHGFLKGKSIISNATPHRNKKHVLNIDLKDFFDSIHYGRVYGYFLTNKHFHLNKDIAHSIANLVCHNGKLPQGAPTSPVISNLIGGILDIRLANLAYKYNLFYTRYADDLSFSTNENKFPREIAYEENGVVVAGRSLRKAVELNGFFINEKKSRLQNKISRQDVTGLIVNKKINIRSEYRNKARVLWHKILNGKEIYSINGNPAEKKDINYLIGVLGYIYQVRKSNNTRTGKVRILNKKAPKKEIDSVLDANERMYRDVLFFKNFVTNSMPVIICEGKTDILYLRSALLSLSHKHRSLVEKKEIKLKFLGLTATIKDLFRINGGTGDIGNLISNYSSYYELFKRFTPSSPVIILIDNDSGAKAVRSLVNQITGKPFTDQDEFVHIVKNLYIMQTPLKDGKDSAIEDFFDKETLDTKLLGKTFVYKQSDFDTKKHFGKNHFAEYVIRPNREKINFSQFNPLIENIKKIIKDYKKTPH